MTYIHIFFSFDKFLETSHVFLFETRPFTFWFGHLGTGSIIFGISLVVLVELVGGGLLSCTLVSSQTRTSILVQSIFGACALLRQS